MEIVYDEPSLRDYFAARGARVGGAAGARSTASSRTRSRPTSTRSRDGERVVIGGVMQHIEDAGIHSGDSACVLPPYLIGEADIETMRAADRRAGARRSASSG